MEANYVVERRIEKHGMVTFQRRRESFDTATRIFVDWSAKAIAQGRKFTRHRASVQGFRMWDKLLTIYLSEDKKSHITMRFAPIKKQDYEVAI